jgi:dTDP-4-dehydrorhamnose reductase
MKILITGSSGMLANDIIDSFSKLQDVSIYGVDLQKSKNRNLTDQFLFDLTNLQKLKEVLSIIKPQLIIQTAAIVNLRLCEENNEIAHKLHVDTSRTLAASGTKIVYLSTDSVFNGIKGNYSETDIPDPVNNYARTKYLGELAISASNSNHIIIRTNIFGFNIPLKNSLCEWAIKSFESKEVISGFTDVKFNALYTKHLAELIKKLVLIDYQGIINLASKDFISKYDFIKYLGKKFNFSVNNLKQVSSTEVSFSVPRPTNTTLNTEKANHILKVPSIYEGLDELYIDYINKRRRQRIIN